MKRDESYPPSMPQPQFATSPSALGQPRAFARPAPMPADLANVYARGTQANDVAIQHKATPRPIAPTAPAPYAFRDSHSHTHDAHVALFAERARQLQEQASAAAPGTGETPVVIDQQPEGGDLLSASISTAPPAPRSKTLSYAIGVVLAVVTAACFFVTRSTKPVTSGTLLPAKSSATSAPESTETDTWPGVLLAPASVDIAPTIDGRLSQVRLNVGDRVEKDDIVALLDDRLHKDALAVALAGKHAAAADAHRASIELFQARDRQTRRDAVVKTDDGQTLQVVSGEEAAQARFATQAAASRAASAGAGAAERAARVKQLKTALSETQLRAPFAGIVAARYADPGTFVRPGQAVLRIIATTDLHVRFAVPEERGKKVAASTKVRVLVDDKVLDATVSAIAPEVEPASRTVFVDASLTGVTGTAAAALAGRVVRVSTK